MRIRLALLLMCLPIGLMAQDYSSLGQSFSEGNANTLANWLASSMELTVYGVTETLSKRDCKEKLQEYFQKNIPSSFTKIHEGVSSSDVHYLIGELATSKGKRRITAYLKKFDDDYLIQSLEIDQ